MDEREIIQKFEEYGIDSAGNLGGYRIRYVSDTENHIIFSRCDSVIAFFFEVGAMIEKLSPSAMFYT